MASQRLPIISPEDFLAWEQQSEQKHEYFDGEIVAMSGTAVPHFLIATNLMLLLGNQLEGTSCLTTGSDMRVSIQSRRAFCYPDVSVVCLPFDLVPGVPDTVLNPVVVIEILSPSTRASDRNRKVPIYREIPTLKGYLLVEQDRMLVEYGYRSAASEWQVDVVSDPAAVLDLSYIGCSLLISRIYKGLELGPRPWPVPAG